MIETGADGHTIEEFLEKPADPPGLPDSTGRDVRLDGQLHVQRRRPGRGAAQDAANPASRHDMGGDIVPMIGLREGKVYDFQENDVPGATEREKAYWRDVGSLDSYHEAHMDLVSVQPVFNLYNPDWPICTYPQMPGAKFTDDATSGVDRLPGLVVSGGSIETSVISPNVQVHEGATVDHSVILSHVTIGQNAVIHHAILDKHVVVPDGAKVRVDSEADEARGFYVSEGGITVVPKGVTVSAT